MVAVSRWAGPARKRWPERFRRTPLPAGCDLAPRGCLGRLRRLRVLHLFSNYKWTGPSEPAHALAVGLRDRGVEIVFRSSGYTKGNPRNHVAERGAARGLAPLTDLDLSKHRKPWRDWRDARRLGLRPVQS